MLRGVIARQERRHVNGISLNISERILLRWSVALAFFLLLIMVLMLALV
jgi:hypothetical protein